MESFGEEAVHTTQTLDAWWPLAYREMTKSNDNFAGGYLFARGLETTSWSTSDTVGKTFLWYGIPKKVDWSFSRAILVISLWKRYKGEFLIISARLSHQLTSLLQEFILRTSCQIPNAIHRRHTSLEGNGCIACPSTYICMDWDPRRSVQSCSEKLCCLPRVS